MATLLTNAPSATFSGSYRPDDVQFLLKPVAFETTEIVEKERLIQSGAKHYSELISPESPPADEYVLLFEAALARSRVRLAEDTLRLALEMRREAGRDVVIVSLARAGTPIGVLLRRTLLRLGCRAKHYSVSIIRDRGIDENAMDYILARHDPEQVLFVDGWTGKGAIAAELEAAIARYNLSRQVKLRSSLYVVADLAGTAGFAATAADYLLPSAILNATVSGLISRSILNPQSVGQGDFHACLYYNQWHAIDRSQLFVDAITSDIGRCMTSPAGDSACWNKHDRAALQNTAAKFIAQTCKRYGVVDRNRIKPGIGEATRALLRRVPERIIVRGLASADVSHLLWLARQRSVPVEVDEELPYQAAAIIRTLGHD